MNDRFYVDGSHLSPEALKRKTQLETDPSARISHMEYLPGMDEIRSSVAQSVLSAAESYDPSAYTAKDVRDVLYARRCGPEGLKALLSPAAAPFLEQLAARAREETARHFGNAVYLFTPLYISNYCNNYCVYCGFNRYSSVKRKKLTPREIEAEMALIAGSGMEEVLILTGESRSAGSVEYIGEACRMAKEYFRLVGVEIYPADIEEYKYLHQCGVDYVTVFQETYDRDAYESLHLDGRKRVWPYRFDSQERALMAGMRGAGFGALLGLADFRKDALAAALHVYYLQRKYPWAEFSLSCPRLRPTNINGSINPLDVGERELCQLLCAWRIFLPFAGITVSSRESASFRNGIIRLAATKVSAGVSTGVGDHGKAKTGEEGQFEIADRRSLETMRGDIDRQGLQPVLNDYLYV
ncbi:MAG: 2-iminoacetate synthase ThiH [Abditibacteriota bacterium]|nr:2-iminoacetate synthase ThiH [Abditibacteriota bacterium]